MQLSSLIEKQAEDLGTDFFGIADLSIAHQFILEQGGPVIAEYPKAISVACHICCKFAVALYPDSTHSSKDKYLLPVIQSSLISIMMQTATLRSD